MAKTTTDHETIRQWVEARGGCPSRVKQTGGDGDPGILRVDFPGFSGKQTLEKIEWDEFFDWFDRNQLAFIYQDRTRGGQPSRFNKLISRKTISAAGGGARRERGDQRSAEGEEDAIALLTSQHREVEDLFERLNAQSPLSAEFRQTFEALADALAVHAEIEERIFYPAVKSEATDDLLEASVEDHLEMKRVLATMLETPAADGNVFGELEELGGLTEEHVIEEEHELFPHVREQMDATELRELASRMRELMAELQRRGDPRLHVREQTEAPAQI